MKTTQIMSSILGIGKAKGFLHNLSFCTDGINLRIVFVLIIYFKGQIVQFDNMALTRIFPLTLQRIGYPLDCGLVATYQCHLRILDLY